MRPPASPKSRFEWVAGNRELAARLTTQRSVTIRQPRRYNVESLNTLLARHSERGVQITGRSRLDHMKLNPKLRAVTDATLTWASAARLGLMSMATRDKPGTVSFRSSRRLLAKSYRMPFIPG